MTASQDLVVEVLSLRVAVSAVGLVGNVILILAIFQTKLSRVKSFELFLLGLAAANLEEIVIVNIYDIVILQVAATSIDRRLCHLLKFLTIFGEISSILFTVLISIYRQQKLRDAHKRVNLPIYLDRIGSAWMVSGLCVMLAALLSLPIFIITPERAVGNSTANSSGCPPDFFQCSSNHCPLLNKVFKYLFIVMCNLLPLIIVTVASCLIITVLLNQRQTVAPGLSVSGSSQFGRKTKGPRLHRSTIAVLAAMGLFQVDWTLYLILQLTVDPSEFPLWAETEFFISTSYTSISPYVYGIGNNLFSCKNFLKK
ncbi:gonadotropin-releasing hormone receptor [Centropristis striata]|uniref:gonadotropin-releasing hormone receptor n=1 Tax=Centropristis striata TaxID=184440 RepID=UPI0027E14ED0|nr:gonadotropin-releasing hormone receptor [Centropristis striata]